jgi:putative signal transducing protein
VDADEPIEVYSTNNANEAELIRSAIAAEGIPCQVTGENQAGLAGITAWPISIMVRTSDYDRARAFIEDHLRRSGNGDEDSDELAEAADEAEGEQE